ncbi:MAG: beta-1-3, beta-1-6-glucan biosynthesis protein [Alphaproteobacteria bacterium]|nr:beta-1-3, beta-1-6-glucan biosynthesis protein [Alphaproteobacteria bacterium]
MSARFGAFASLAVLAAMLAGVPGPAFSQAPEQKPTEQKPTAGDKRESVPKRIDEIAEIGRLMTGPASNPECVWLGRRVISLLWRDDLDTAFRHLDLYDRFGCPGGQIQATFRCLVRQGDIDPKAPDALNGRIHACWINPSVPAAPTTAASAETAPTTAKQ